MPSYIILRKPLKQVNDIYISMTVSVTIPRAILVNVNELQQEDFKRILNDSQVREIFLLKTPYTIRTRTPCDFVDGYVHFICRISILCVL